MRGDLRQDFLALFFQSVNDTARELAGVPDECAIANGGLGEIPEPAVWTPGIVAHRCHVAARLVSFLTGILGIWGRSAVVGSVPDS